MNLRKDHYRSFVAKSSYNRDLQQKLNQIQSPSRVFVFDTGAVFFSQSFFASSLPAVGWGLRNPTKKALFFKAGVRGGDRMKRGLWCLGRPVWLPVSGYLVCCAAPGGGLDLKTTLVLSHAYLPLLLVVVWLARVSFCSAGLLGSKSDMPES